jgi:hypothetical protein
MSQSTDIAIFERVGRFIFGSFILIGILQFALPSSLSFIAVYVILTAIINWEPFYALCAFMQTLLSQPKPQLNLTKEPALST